VKEYKGVDDMDSSESLHIPKEAEKYREIDLKLPPGRESPADN